MNQPISDFSDKGGRGGKPISDFWLTRGGGGLNLPIFDWHNMWTASNNLCKWKMYSKSTFWDHTMSVSWTLSYIVSNFFWCCIEVRHSISVTSLKLYLYLHLAPEWESEFCKKIWLWPYYFKWNIQNFCNHCGGWAIAVTVHFLFGKFLIFTYTWALMK